MRSPEAVVAPTAEPWASLDDYLRRTISAAKAVKGYSWEEVARQVQARGWKITPGNLMTRHSRGAFRADELLLLMDVLGMGALTLPTSQPISQ